MSRLLAGATALVWLAAVIAIAFGAAGIVASMEPAPADGSRSGRTVPGDELVGARLATIELEMAQLRDRIDALGDDARAALAALTTNDASAADAAVAAGDVLLGDVVARAEIVRGHLAAVPLVGTAAAAYEVSPAVRERHADLVTALDASPDLEVAWSRLTAGAVRATNLSRLLAAHDAAVLAAAERGRDADYGAALTKLADADEAITAARAMRDQLAATVDVTTLDQWLDRNAAYDVALRRLYLAVRASGGAATDAVRAAIKAEAAAKARLPPDLRALVLIMAEIGVGEMNEAVTTIEQTRADLDEVLAPAATGPPP